MSGESNTPMSPLAATWEEFFTELWHAEIWSWASFWGLLVLMVLGVLIFK